MLGIEKIVLKASSISLMLLYGVHVSQISEGSKFITMLIITKDNKLQKKPTITSKLAFFFQIIRLLCLLLKK